MAHPTKIATCCYCGTRAALVLTGKTRHELSCTGCGAPLHDLKMLKSEKKKDRDLPGKTAVSHLKPGKKHTSKKAKTKSRKKKSKPRFGHLLGEAFDLIEDIFD